VDDRRVVLHGREGVVQVVEEPAPLLGEGRTPEALGAVLWLLPLHEEQVPRRTLEAPVQAQRPESGHGGDDGSGLIERILEALLVAPSHIETGLFEHHGPILPHGTHAYPGSPPARLLASPPEMRGP
jgi:hypothetical protein